MKAKFNNLLKNITSTLSKDDLSVFKIIVKLKQASKSEIVEESLFQSTKTYRIIRNLYDLGYIEEEQQSSKNRGRGRLLYSAQPDLGYFLGVELNTMYDRIVLRDFSCKTLAQQQYESSYRQKDTTEAVKCMIKRFLAEKNIQKESIIAIGLGLHGIVDEHLHIIQKPFTEDAMSVSESTESDSSDSDINTFPLEINTCIQREFSIPTYLSRPRLLVFLSEFEHTMPRRAKFILSVHSGYSVGMGIFIDGEFYEPLGAGRLGHVVVPGNNEQCYCGNKGCLRTLISYHGICQQALKLLEQGVTSSLDLKFLKQAECEIGVRHIVEQAQKADRLSINLIHGIAELLGTQLAETITILNPAYMTIHSALVGAGEMFTNPLKLQLERKTLPSSLSSLKVEFRFLDTYGIAEGAAVFAMQQFLLRL